MKNKTPIICAKCGQEFNGGGWDEITYHKCVKPIRTNADRIRAMSDEELAEELYDNSNIDCCQRSAIMDWLKQEVE